MQIKLSVDEIVEILTAEENRDKLRNALEKYLGAETTFDCSEMDSEKTSTNFRIKSSDGSIEIKTNIRTQKEIESEDKKEELFKKAKELIGILEAI